MGTASFLLLLCAVSVQSLACPTGQLPCGTSGCYDPITQGCTNNGAIIQCINSCNGTCYSNSQYCYNNTKVCNNGELVCNVQSYNSFQWHPFGLTCYNSSQYVCSNNTICSMFYSCGTQCVSYDSSCASNDQTTCYGFRFYDYYWKKNSLQLCGPQQQCYDNTTSICTGNNDTVCPIGSQLCAGVCYNSQAQTCTNGNIQCTNSCNGTCYSNSQYCYNNTKVCNNGELVCNVQSYNSLDWHPLGLTCYNSSQYVCSNNTICSMFYSCGTQCGSYDSSCASDGQTTCYGFRFYDYYWKKNSLQLCGPQQQCYDNTTSICTGNNDTVCPIGSQLCAGVCYNPQAQYCNGGNNTIFCLNNPSSVNCLHNTTIDTSSTSRSTTVVTTKPTTTTLRTTVKETTTTPRTTTVTTTAMPSSCCPVKNCTKNSDCCQSNIIECQCFRHIPSDVYGSCVNPTMTPICGDSCPVKGKCKADADCCKCQCATVAFIDADGKSVTTKQCARR